MVFPNKKTFREPGDELVFRGVLRIFKMERFAKIVKDYQPLTIFAKVPS